MAKTAFICLRRNDLPLSLLQVTDLVPNTSQRNYVYDPPGQSGYINPINVVQNTAITALAASDPDGAGGNTHLSTTLPEYGLQAYLRDRVNVNPGINDTSLSVAEAATIANAIVTRVAAGSSLTLADVNTIINASVAGADSGLTSADGFSFGTLEDVLRILSGEVYLVSTNTVVTLIAATAWVSQADRITAIATNTANFFPNGSFVTSTDATYRPFRRLYDTGALQISAGEGVLSKLKAATFEYLNPLFYYAGVAIPGKTAAQTKASTPANIPATGVYPAVVVYDSLGNVL